MRRNISKDVRFVPKARKIFMDASAYSDYEVLGYYRLVKALCKKLKQKEIRKIQIAKIKEQLDLLDDRKYNIMRCRYWEGNIREEIAYMFSISAERVRQLEEKAFKILGFLVDEQINEEQEIPIEVLNLKTRSYSALKRAGINTINNLGTLSQCELLQIKGIGRGVEKDIKEKMADYIKRITVSQQETFMKLPIDVLRLSVRASNALKREGILIIEQLFKKSKEELASIKCIGAKCLDEISQKIAEVTVKFNNSRCQVIASCLDTQGMNARILRVLEAAGVKTVGEFMKLTKNEVITVWHVGERTWQEIYERQQQIKNLVT